MQEISWKIATVTNIIVKLLCEDSTSYIICRPAAAKYNQTPWPRTFAFSWFFRFLCLRQSTKLADLLYCWYIVMYVLADAAFRPFGKVQFTFSDLQRNHRLRGEIPYGNPLTLCAVHASMRCVCQLCFGQN